MNMSTKILCALIILLVTAIVVQTKRLDTLKTKHEDIASKLKLAENDLAKIRIDGNKVSSNSRKDGTSSTFRPPEGRVDITISENKKLKEQLKDAEGRLETLKNQPNADPQEIERLKREVDKLRGNVLDIHVNVQRWGFTFRPGIGVVYAPKVSDSGDVRHLLLPEIDFKFLFFDRYSLKAGLNLQFIDIGISRHIDDLIPFFKLENLEIQGLGGVEYSGGWRLGVGARVNL